MIKQTEEQMIQEFIKAFGATLDVRMYLKFMNEELAELQMETPGTTAHLKELCDLAYVTQGLGVVMPEYPMSTLLPSEEFDAASVMNEAIAEEFARGESLYSQEVQDEAFRRVHLSNMSKLGEDGKPIYREDGKVMKGPNYKEPDLEDLIDV